jgi:uncharacterized protein DUF2845
MRSTPLLLGSLVFLLPGLAAASQESSLRCERGIVAVGDTKIDLLGKCGEPALREEWGTGGWTLLRAGAASVARGAVQRERWTYDFGPSRFVMSATLEGGKVVAFERGNYGYDASRSGAAVAVRRARCAPEAVHVGDTTYDVLSRCGDPASADGREEPRAIEIANGTFESRMVIVEVWVYDFGPQTFTRLLEFENGKLVKIEAGTWGYSQ